MNTTGPVTGPNQGRSTTPGSSGHALLIGGIAFALVFLLIVGGTVMFLVLRSGGGSPGAGGRSGGEVTSTPPTESESPTSSPSSETPSASLKPSEDGEWCWSPENQKRVSKNPSGKLRGGGLDIIPPQTFDMRTSVPIWAFTTDAQTAGISVESTWSSSVTVGRLQWQDGYEYPGDEVASQRLINCISTSPGTWGSGKGRKLSDIVTEPVTINGIGGYRSTATLSLGDPPPLKATDSYTLTVYVLNTESGPSVLAAEIATGVKDHEEGLNTVVESVTEVR